MLSSILSVKRRAYAASTIGRNTAPLLMRSLAATKRRSTVNSAYSKGNSVQTTALITSSSSSDPELDTDLDDACALYSTPQGIQGSIGSSGAKRGMNSGRNSASSAMPTFTLSQLQLLQQLLRSQQPSAAAALQRSASDESLPVCNFFLSVN